jgi:hypothetical protein
MLVISFHPCRCGKQGIIAAHSRLAGLAKSKDLPEYEQAMFPNISIPEPRKTGKQVLESQCESGLCSCTAWNNFRNRSGCCITLELCSRVACSEYQLDYRLDWPKIFVVFFSHSKLSPDYDFFYMPRPSTFISLGTAAVSSAVTLQLLSIKIPRYRKSRYKNNWFNSNKRWNSSFSTASVYASSLCPVITCWMAFYPTSVITELAVRTTFVVWIVSVLKNTGTKVCRGLRENTQSIVELLRICTSFQSILKTRISLRSHSNCHTTSTGLKLLDLHYKWHLGVALFLTRHAICMYVNKYPST